MHVSRMYSTIDAHAGGQPLRIVTSGVPPLHGEDYAERRRDLMANHDDVRRTLLHEPRGHSDMYGAVLTASSHPEVDYGVIFMTNEGYSTMCGHGIIALTTALIESGTWPGSGTEPRIRYETPAGIIEARASVDAGRVLAVRFRNVPSFRFAHNLEVPVRNRTVTVDVAFGGAWYAIVADAELGLTLGKSPARDLVDAGMAVKRAVSNALDIVHPLDRELAGLYGTIILGRPSDDELSLRNATIYADGAIDRSPCGTGTSALVACLAESGALEVGDTLTNESLTGATFTGRIVVRTTVGDFPAVVPEIAGAGAITGMHQFVVDRDDPIHESFLIR